MSKELQYIIVLLFMVTLAASQTAIADPPSVALAEDTLPPNPGDLIGLPSTTTTTTTTTTTLQIIPACPASPTSADVGLTGSVVAGSDSGLNYWSFDDRSACTDYQTGTDTLYCFENPGKDVNNLHKLAWVQSSADHLDKSSDYIRIAMNNIVSSPAYGYIGDKDACFICTCIRLSGCFPPGVKITMADGSLRNIEDIRADDLVRNAKTGAPVKVGRVIEGPEALPLIRFGFDGATVTTSQAHPVLTAAGLKPANQLTKGDTVFDAQGNPHPVTILERLPIEEGQRVINVDLAAASSDTNERLLISDGIITGDLVLQGLLKERK